MLIIKIHANITNNQNLNKINKSETNFDDDTIILHEQSSEEYVKLTYSGLSKRKIKRGTFNELGKTQKYGKKEVEEISSIITEVAPSLIASKNRIETMQKKLLKEKTKPSDSKSTIEKGKKLGGKY